MLIYRYDISISCTHTINSGLLNQSKKMAFLITGYNTSSTSQQAKYNINELTKQVGNFVCGLSLIMFILSIGLFILPRYEAIILTIGPLFLVIYLIVGIIYLNLNKSIYM